MYTETGDEVRIRFGALENDLSQGADPLLQAETTSLTSSPRYTSSSSQGSESGSLSMQTLGLSIHRLLTRLIEEMLDSGPHHKAKLPQVYKCSRRISVTTWYPNLCIKFNICSYSRLRYKLSINTVVGARIPYVPAGRL